MAFQPYYITDLSSVFGSDVPHHVVSHTYGVIASKMLIKAAIALLTGVTVLVDGSACPYSGSNEGHNSRSLLDPDHRLEPRFQTGSAFGKCSSKRLSKYAGGGSRSQDWWPCELSLDVLRQNGKESNPLGADFIYANEFAKLDCKSGRLLEHVRVLTTSSCPIETGSHRLANNLSRLVAC